MNIDENEQIIGKWVREKRLSKGLDIRGLSSLSGVTINQISRIENGLSAVTCRAVVRLCFGLDIKLYDFMVEMGYGRTDYRETITISDNHKTLPMDFTALDLEAFRLAYRNDLLAAKNDLIESWVQILETRNIFEGDLWQIATDQINKATLESGRSPIEYPTSRIDLSDTHDSGGVITYLDAGDYLRNQRQQWQKTLVDIQVSIGLPQSVLSRIENGEMENIRFGYVLKLNQLFSCDPSILSMFLASSEFHSGIDLFRAISPKHLVGSSAKLQPKDYLLDPYQDTLLRIARWSRVCNLSTWLDKERAKWGMYNHTNEFIPGFALDRYLAPDFFNKAWDTMWTSVWLLVHSPMAPYPEISSHSKNLFDIFCKRVQDDPVTEQLLKDMREFSDSIFTYAVKSRFLKAYLIDEQLREEVTRYITEYFPDFVK